MSIEITGLGIISSIGQNIKDFGSSLKNGRSAITRRRLLPGKADDIQYLVAEIDDFDFSTLAECSADNAKGLVKKAITCGNRCPITIQTAIGSALEAWKMAHLSRHSFDSERMGIVIAGHNIHPNYAYTLRPKFYDTPEYLTPRYALHFMDSDHIGTISEIFGIKGEGITVGGASASGNIAVIKGAQMIQSGAVDLCMVVAPHVELSPMEIQGFINIGAMGGKKLLQQPHSACRPFDKAHEGFIYGKASACIILERHTSALQRKVQVLAQICGGAIVLDGNRSANPSAEGEIRSMRIALEQAQLKPNDIDYLNAHGTSSPLGDETEITAIKSVFKNHLCNMPINATKGLTGHCLCSSGVVECIATVLQMKENFLHPNLNLERPIDTQCIFCGNVAQKTKINTAINNSFGFGGINTSIILKKMEHNK